MTEEEFEERMKEVKSLTRVDVEHYIDESMREIKLPDGSSQRIWYHGNVSSSKCGTNRSCDVEALAIACEHGTTISTLEDLMRARAERQKIETGIAARRSGTAGNNAVNVSDLGETLESLKM